MLIGASVAYLYLLASVADDTLKNVHPHSVATALANMVLPVPGGPNNITPCAQHNRCMLLNRQAAGQVSLLEPQELSDDLGSLVVLTIGSLSSHQYTRYSLCAACRLPKCIATLQALQIHISCPTI